MDERPALSVILGIAEVTEFGMDVGRAESEAVAMKDVDVNEQDRIMSLMSDCCC